MPFGDMLATSTGGRSYGGDPQYFDPITGGAIPGGYSPNGKGGFSQDPSQIAGAYTGGVINPGGKQGFTIDPTHADIAAKYGLKVGDEIDPSHPAFQSIFPDQKQENFLTGVLAPFLASVALGAGGAALSGAGEAGVGVGSGVGGGAGGAFDGAFAGNPFTAAGVGAYEGASGFGAAPGIWGGAIQQANTLGFGAEEAAAAAAGAGSGAPGEAPIDAAAAGVLPDAGGFIAPTNAFTPEALPSAPMLPGAPGTIAPPGEPSVIPAGISGNTPRGTLGDFGDFLKSNKNLILPGAALGASVLKKGPGVDPNISALATEMRARSSGTSAQAQGIINDALAGKLPPGAETSVNNALQDARNSIKSKYAQLGMSGSTAEAQELASADARAEATKFQMTQQLLQTGLQESGISDSELANASQLYSIIMNTELQNDAQLRNALAAFAGSAALSSAVNQPAKK